MIKSEYINFSYNKTNHTKKDTCMKEDILAEQNNKEENKDSFFDEKLNISYIPQNTPKPDNQLILKHYFCSIQIYGFIIILYWLNPFFSSAPLEVKLFYSFFFLAYVFIAPIIYFTVRPKSIHNSHSIEICNYITRIFISKTKLSKLNISEIKNFLEYFKPTYREKQSLMLIFIKTFFGILMVQSLYVNLDGLHMNLKYFFEIAQSLVMYFTKHTTTLAQAFPNQYRQFLYEQSITILYTIDLAIFSFGYLTELSIFKNKIRTVETTAAGIFFCLACYSPFVMATNSFLGWNQNDVTAAFGDETSALTWSIRLIALCFLTIYVAASAALGTKGSNLTNRGTVTCFPYNIVRHPAYICKNTFWIITTLTMFIVDFTKPGFDFGDYFSKLFLAVTSLIGWALIYYFRAVTEERHLIQDPEYRAYTKKVKYRFIPGII